MYHFIGGDMMVYSPTTVVEMISVTITVSIAVGPVIVSV
jgi:hypothetical protein